MMHILANGNSFDLAKNLSGKLTDYKGYFQAMHFNWLKFPKMTTLNMFKGILSCYIDTKSTFTGFRNPADAKEGVNEIKKILQANQQCHANTQNDGPLVLYIGILKNTSYDPTENLDKSEPNATEFTIISDPYTI